MSIYPIVGAYYRPPAQVLLNFLAVGAKLKIVPDDHNEYDVNAMAVVLPTASLPAPTEPLLSALAGYGIDAERYTEFEDVHVGYIPREVAGALAARGQRHEYDCTFDVSPTGKPRVRIEE